MIKGKQHGRFQSLHTKVYIQKFTLKLFSHEQLGISILLIHYKTVYFFFVHVIIISWFSCID